ncbi:MAG TPA: LacI family DNA-binding transcriptional regulator [Rhizomicrobium sp.]|nr:LacI family DNA-binding transcriptional regulator [Rhizomicrobium sp.]
MSKDSTRSSARGKGMKDPSKRASIYDVAARAGVSIKTVSRVVNNKPNISDETRARVQKAAADLAYRPNIHARGLASEHSFLIGLLYDNPSPSYVAGVQLGAMQECRERGYHLIVEELDSQSAGLRQAVRALAEQSSLHGVILTPPLCDAPAVLKALAEAGQPFVQIAPARVRPGVPYVSIDEFQAGLEMTEYLIGLGHRRIAFIKGNPHHGASQARYDGYRKGLAAAGIPFAEELCVQGYFSYQSGVEAGEMLLSLKERPTAIFSSNDDMAAGVLAASQRFDLKIPQDLSVAGFDDSEIAHVVWPRLTTCRQPIREMAAEAVSMLIERPDPDALGRHLSHQLIVGESTAAPMSARRRA